MGGKNSNARWWLYQNSVRAPNALVAAAMRDLISTRLEAEMYKIQGFEVLGVYVHNSCVSSILS